MARGKSIELFFIDGHTDGMKAATIPFQWSGHVLVASRTQLKDLLNRPEAQRPGIYLLVGERDDAPLLYIGETDEIGERLKNHASKKDWWSEAICITSNGEPLNKAHVRYLESRLISDAYRLRRIALDNAQSPPDRTLSEAARAHMDDFLENIYLVLPALRFDFFTEYVRPSSSRTEDAGASETTFVTFVPELSLIARARIVDGQFVVEAGSHARATWIGTTEGHSGYQSLFERLIDQGILVNQGDYCVFTQAYGFNSPSAAGAVIKGRSTAGPITWKVEGTGMTYKDWEANQIQADLSD